MAQSTQSGREPFVFGLRDELSTLPASAQAFEGDLHGGFAVDNRKGQGEVYYGMPGCGLMRVDSDLQHQEIIALPINLKSVNFHSTKIGHFDGNWRLFLPADGDEMVVVMDLEGKVDFILPRPVFEEY